MIAMRFGVRAASVLGKNMACDSRRMMRLPIGMALALLAGAALASSEARASCGDYVMLGGNAAHATPAATDLPQHPSSGSSEKGRPCSGPLCSRAPSSLPLSPAPSASVGGEQWGWLVAGDIPNTADQSSYPLDDGQGRPIDHV